MLLEFIRVDPPSQTAEDSKTVTFNCTVTGTAPFTVVWLNSTMNKLMGSSMNQSLMDGNVTLTLVLTNVTNTSYQNYTCAGIRTDNQTFVSTIATLSKLFEGIGYLSIVGLCSLCS